jgi:hydrogenase maturation protease
MAANSNAMRTADTAGNWPEQTAKTLVLGFGNVLLSDDGAGVRLMERLREELGDAAAEFVDAGTMSFGLLTHVETAGSLLVIDAANIHEPPATVGVFEGTAMDQFLRGFRRRTVHEVGLIDLMDCARLLGCLPRQRALICIQPQSINWSTSLSAPVERAMREAAQCAKAILQRWRAG